MELGRAELSQASWGQMKFGRKNERSLDDLQNEKMSKIISLSQIKKQQESFISLMIYGADYSLMQKIF